MTSGKPKREDYHYTKHGSCALLLAFEPLTGRRWAKVYERRTAKAYTAFMQHLEQQFPEAQQLEHEVLAWVRDRHAKRTTVSWQFSIGAARDTLARHYLKCRKS